MMSLPIFGPPDPSPLSALLPDENLDVRKDVENVFSDSKVWLNTPNAHFGGLTPEDAIQGGQEMAVRNLLRQIKYIGMT